MEKRVMMKTVRLRNLEEKLSLILKSKSYLDRESSKLRSKESEVRKKISMEKKAISLIL